MLLRVSVRSARKLPSASRAISAVLTWSRPCASLMKASDRSAGPLDGAAQLAGGPGDDGFLGVVVDLAAEAAADVGGDDAEFVLGDVENEGAHEEADDVGVLAGGVEGEVAGRAVEIADGAAGFEGVGDEAVVVEV